LAQAASAHADLGQLKVAEVFYSLQGEALFAGWPTVFVRLTGCPLRCRYCDTEYAFYGGQWIAVTDLLGEVAQHAVKHVCVTGGEPLAQKRCLALLKSLCDADYSVSLETSGALDISAVDPRVHRVVDLKTPGSGESARNLYTNVELLGERDCVKFVICDRQDYEWSRQILKQYRLAERCGVFFSPSFQQLPAADLAAWLMADELPVRLQLQLHKLIWGEEPGR
jgi:7-carboxy-7-deazaguanine synthase